MAKSAAAVKQWLENRKRFANLFNVKVFDGVQVIHPDELEPVDGENHIQIQTPNGKEQDIHRYRDITMRWKGEMNLMILACENQDKIHYAMPVRTMIYDGLSYVQQMKLLWDLRDKDEKMSSDEFLSRFRKEDKICPVLTLVFYYGEEEWDASLDLYGMFNIENTLRENKNLRKYIPNYTINLIDGARIEDCTLFEKDLQIVLGLLKCRKDKQKLKQYVEDNKEFFKSVDVETGMVISSFINSESIKKTIEQQKEGAGVDMCKAMEDWAAEERKEGREEKAIEIAKNLLNILEIEVIAEKVGLPVKVIRNLQDN